MFVCKITDETVSTEVDAPSPVCNGNPPDTGQFSLIKHQKYCYCYVNVLKYIFFFYFNEFSYRK